LMKAGTVVIGFELRRKLPSGEKLTWPGRAYRS
jgi:hypothetical protein